MVNPTPLLRFGGYAGCLSGDTVLEYNRGDRVNVRPIALRDLYLKFNGLRGAGRGAAQQWDTSVPTFLHSLWPDGTVSRNRILNVFESGVKTVVRIDFNDGRHLVLTEDHPIATPTGEFVEAGSLEVGEARAGSRLHEGAEGDGRRLDLRPPRIIVNTKYHPRGAAKTTVCRCIAYEYKRVPRAQLVIEADLNGIPYEKFLHILKNDEISAAKLKYLPEGMDVHHLDEDTLNDTINNLHVVPHAEHARLHSQEGNLDLEYTREIAVIAVTKAGELMTYDIQMQAPANNFAANGIFVHNTGKSTLLALLAYSHPFKKIAFCAYTGKAAGVLRQKIFMGNAHNHEVSTIHSLIYKPIIDGKTGEVRAWVRKASLEEYDYIVIDEASMVDEALYQDLSSYGIPILATGDHGQLPPVMGNFNLMENPDLRLEKIHRQAQDNPILKLSVHIRQYGDLPNGLMAEQTIRYIDRASLPSLLGEIYATPDVNVGNAAVLCYKNKTRQMINGMVRSLRFPDTALDAPVPGDQLICLRNARDTVFNGMRGMLAGINPYARSTDACKAAVSFTDDEIEFDGPISKYQFGQLTTFKSFEEARALRRERRERVGRRRPAHGLRLRHDRAQGAGQRLRVRGLDLRAAGERQRRRLPALALHGCHEV